MKIVKTEGGIKNFSGRFGMVLSMNTEMRSLHTHSKKIRTLSKGEVASSILFEMHGLQINFSGTNLAHSATKSGSLVRCSATD